MLKKQFEGIKYFKGGGLDFSWCSLTPEGSRDAASLALSCTFLCAHHVNLGTFTLRQLAKPKVGPKDTFLQDFIKLIYNNSYPVSCYTHCLFI